MADMSNHDALCLARRFKTDACTCGANKTLTQPWRAAWTPEPMGSGNRSRTQVERTEAEERELKRIRNYKQSAKQREKGRLRQAKLRARRKEEAQHGS